MPGFRDPPMPIEDGRAQQASGELSLAMIRDAHERIKGVINRTPLMTSSVLDAYVGRHLYFKCESFQKTGSFKARGAANAVLSLSSEGARRGVVTHSSGNHAAAVARAASLRGIPAYVVMPSTAPRFKQAAVARYGGKVILCKPTQEERESTAARVAAETGAALIHAYDDLRVMAGQGTAAIELLETAPHLDSVVCPVGGGGLLSGVAVASKAIKPDIRVIGVEPEGADDAARSFEQGHVIYGSTPVSVADGLLTSLSETTFREIQRHVDAFAVVTETEIIEAMRRLWEVMKLLVEPSGAVAFASMIRSAAAVAGKHVGVIVSGGNLDLDVLPWQKQVSVKD